MVSKQTPAEQQILNLSDELKPLHMINSNVEYPDFC